MMLLVVSGDGKLSRIKETNFHDAGKPFGWWDVVHSNLQATSKHSRCHRHGEAERVHGSLAAGRLDRAPSR